MVLCLRDPRQHSWRWRPILEKWGHLRVFINPIQLSSTTFLVYNDAPDSSVFFVKWPLDDAGHVAYYAVTTGHSVKGKKVSIRFNLKRGGGTYDKPIDPLDWVPSLTTDLAVLPINFPIDDYEIWPVEKAEFAQHRFSLSVKEVPPYRELIDQYHTGDEVFTVGLFEGHTGERLAQPVARFGHIALQPKQGEQISAECDPLSEDLTPIDAFLVEIAAWQGQSGSPVFLRAHVDEHNRTLLRDDDEMVRLIGIIQGFYPGEQTVESSKGETFKIPLNMGIGIVIPTEQLADMLENREELVKDRARQLKEKSKPKIRPSAASINRKQPEENSGVTREGFEDALRRASRKTSSGPKTKKQGG
jgi:hypothetical protein